MAFRIADFWRWASASSARYNDVVNTIAAWRPDEVENHSVLSRHLAKPPTFLLTDHTDEPESVALGVPLCEVILQPGGVKGPRIFAIGFFWAEDNDLNPAPNTPSPADWDFFITTGSPYDLTYLGENVHKPPHGWLQAGFDPMNGHDVSVLRYGGGHVMMCTLTLDEFAVGHSKVAMFGPRLFGRAMLVVMSEDNS